MKKVVIAIFIVLALFVVYKLGLAAFNIWIASSKEDAAHLVAKQDYLRQLSGLPPSEQRPNIIVILFDDLGYGDLGAFGANVINTPQIDRVASQGTKFTRYYAPAPNCTPSRVGLLTGRLPIHTSLSRVIHPRNSAMDLLQRADGHTTRLPTDEILLPEMLKHAGYATKMIGKWHLGDVAPSLPNNFGFDDFYGVRYSNDMKPLNLYRNSEIVEKNPIDQTQLTAKYTREAVDFIANNKSKPFFLYFAHNFPHIPLYASAEQKGKSDAGLYGDVVEDLDRSVGAVIAALEANGIADNTLVLITSDNGPWFQGSAGEHRGRKNDTFEGGMSVPFIAYWPGKIPAGTTSDAVISGLDVVPTALDLLNLPKPTDRQIDGFSIKSLLLENKPSPRTELFYNSEDQLFALRDGRFKYQARRAVAPGGIETNGFAFGSPMGPWLFDLQTDPVESYDVSMKYSDKFAALQKRFEEKAADLKKNPRGWIKQTEN